MHVPPPPTSPAAWAAATADLPCTSEARVALHQWLTACYAAPTRVYHGLDHVAHLLSLAETHRRHLQDPLAVTLAIWFHDVVYQPGKGDNEARSAAEARRRLPTLGLAPARVHKVCRMILATQDHQPDDLDDDGRLFLDLDLAILAQDRATYQAYAHAVRREHAHVPTPMFRQARRRFLQHMLARPRLYHHPATHAQWETPARANLQWECDQDLTDRDQPLALATGGWCVLHRIRRTFLPNYYVLAYPKAMGEPPPTKEAELIALGLDQARLLARDLVGNPEAYTVFYSGYSARRAKGWHLHIFVLGRRWRKAWLYLMLSTKNLLQMLHLRKDDAP